MSENIILKIVILGASTVGKTSIFIRYFQKEFKTTITSVGVDFKPKFFKLEGEKIKVNYIDTAGQEKFKSISQNYLKSTDGVILVFDITNKETLNLINYWEDFINKNSKPNIGKILFGNKLDLADNREVEYEEGKNLANKLKCKYYEGSAKTGENIEFIMNEIAKITYNEYKKSEENRKTLRLSSSGGIEVATHRKKMCCKK